MKILLRLWVKLLSRANDPALKKRRLRKVLRRFPAWKEGHFVLGALEAQSYEQEKDLRSLYTVLLSAKAIQQIERGSVLELPITKLQKAEYSAQVLFLLISWLFYEKRFAEIVLVASTYRNEIAQLSMREQKTIYEFVSGALAVAEGREAARQFLKSISPEFHSPQMQMLLESLEWPQEI